MPQPASVSDAADQVIDLYRQAEQRLLARLRDIVGDRARTVEAGRLAAMIRATVTELDQLDHQVAVELNRQLRTVYEDGGRAMATSMAAQWTQIGTEAVEQLAARSIDSVANTLQGVTASTKRALRRLARLKAGDVIVGGQPLQQASELFSRDAARQLGILTVTYSNGAVHSLADWADTAVRTETAVAHNAGGFGLARAYRVKFLEVYDGSACGWTFHDDPDLADGTIRPIEECERQPLSHPRCARSFAGRPDITSKRQAEQARPRSKAEQARRAAEERAREAEHPNRTGRDLSIAHQTRQPRSHRKPRTPRTARTRQPTPATELQQLGAAMSKTTPLKAAQIREMAPAQGKALLSALKTWEGDNYGRLQGQVNALLAGEKINASDAATALAETLQGAGHDAPTLYRGMHLPEADWDRVVNGIFADGETVDIPASSFSSDVKTGISYGGDRYSVDNTRLERGVVFQIEKGSSGLNGEGVMRRYGGVNSEWVSGGRYTVVSHRTRWVGMFGRVYDEEQAGTAPRVFVTLRQIEGYGPR